MTPKKRAQARAFLMKNGERPAKGVSVNRWVEEFLACADDNRLTFSQTLTLIRRDRASKGRPTGGQNLERDNDQHHTEARHR